MKNVFKFDQSVSFDRLKGLCDICTLDGSVVSRIKIDYDIRRPYISTILTIWTKKKKVKSMFMMRVLKRFTKMTGVVEGYKGFIKEEKKEV